MDSVVDGKPGMEATPENNACLCMGGKISEGTFQSLCVFGKVQWPLNFYGWWKESLLHSAKEECK